VTDFYAVAIALAHRFDPGVTTPAAPAGEQDIREATANLPDALGPLPAVLVFTESGVFSGHGGGGQLRLGAHTFRVRFYLELGVDLARDEVRLRKWASVLVDRLKVSVELGGVVKRSAVVAWSMGAMTYGATPNEYSGVELVVEAITSESWAAS
jgi:hypothetical protein